MTDAGDPTRWRSPQRVAMLEPERVVALSIDGAQVGSVLDVGTGTGLFAEAFSAAGAMVTGIDLSADGLEVARRHVPDGVFVLAGAEELPFDDGSFDLAFLGLVLHETDDPVRALGEAARVARARVVVLEWPYRVEESGPPLEHRLKPDEIESHARAAGLRVCVMTSLSRVDLYVLARQAAGRRSQEVRVPGSRDEGPVMYAARMDAIVNRWFTTYEGARASLQSEGGYLLPYRNQYFVTLREGIRELGLDPDDPDWERIGWDWVRPDDAAAWERLKSKRELVI
jgi:SAM-dependent methyltransferase